MKQIVIEVDDFIYEALKEDVDCGTVNLNHAVVNGIVLPDGHGDLIDRNVAFDVYHNANLSWNGSGLLKYIPTVIPADKK